MTNIHKFPLNGCRCSECIELAANPPKVRKFADVMRELNSMPWTRATYDARFELINELWYCED